MKIKIPLQDIEIDIIRVVMNRLLRLCLDNNLWKEVKIIFDDANIKYTITHEN